SHYTTRRPTRSSLFPYTTLFRSRGRTFRREEEEPGQSRVAIVTNDFWRGRFNGDPEIVGRKVLLNAQPYEIVGVLPSAFWWNSRDRKSTRLNSSHEWISYAVFCL